MLWNCKYMFQIKTIKHMQTHVTKMELTWIDNLKRDLKLENYH
jgi:hypothetical protein